MVRNTHAVDDSFPAMVGNPHRRAGIAYGLLGGLVVLLTFLFELVPPEREGAVLELAVGAIFIAIFAALIYRGWWMLSLLLVFTNLWRGFQFLRQGLGWRGGVDAAGAPPAPAEPLAFVNVGLLGIVVVFLAHSAWAGWNRHRQVG